jgi:hypothetical protein
MTAFVACFVAGSIFGLLSTFIFKTKRIDYLLSYSKEKLLEVKNEKDLLEEKEKNILKLAEEKEKSLRSLVEYKENNINFIIEQKCSEYRESLREKESSLQKKQQEADALISSLKNEYLNLDKKLLKSDISSSKNYESQTHVASLQVLYRAKDNHTEVPKENILNFRNYLKNRFNNIFENDKPLRVGVSISYFYQGARTGLIVQEVFSFSSKEDVQNAEFAALINKLSWDGRVNFEQILAETKISIYQNNKEEIIKKKFEEVLKQIHPEVLKKMID